MCRFIETLRIENSKIWNIDLHSSRLNRTRKKFFSSEDYINLKNFIKIPPHHSDGIIKCRIVYSQDIESIEYLPYTLKTIRKVKLANCNDIDYSYKNLDRSAINRLSDLKKDCDDILIIKNNLVTDLSFANAVFSDGSSFYTPSTPLLKGVMREKLISENRIKEIRITADDIKSFENLFMINAMIKLGQLRISVSRIIY